MRYEGDNRQQGLYDHYMVGESMGLLDWLMANLHESRTKIKATLQGQGIKVNGKVVTQFDFPFGTWHEDYSQQDQAQSFV